jgi:hypothetical protein
LLGNLLVVLFNAKHERFDDLDDLLIEAIGVAESTLPDDVVKALTTARASLGTEVDRDTLTDKLLEIEGMVERNY